MSFNYRKDIDFRIRSLVTEFHLAYCPVYTMWYWMQDKRRLKYLYRSYLCFTI